MRAVTALPPLARLGRPLLAAPCHRSQLVVIGRRDNMDFSPKSPEVNVESMRKPYRCRDDAFREEHLKSREPIGQFRAWFEDATKTPGILEANAMCLSTATTDGRPSARFVLLKGFGRDGFRFFTNYESRKAAELDSNPLAALTFYWEPLNRSVRIEGKVRRLPADVSEQYFRSRPLASQIGALLGAQSSVVRNRSHLEGEEALIRMKHGTDKMPIPMPNWGGYIVEPTEVEFWQGQTTRIHDRIRFRRRTAEDLTKPFVRHGEDGWVYERLAP